MEEDRYTRITLRIPKDLHANLEAAAEAASKSLNAEIIGRLMESFHHHAVGSASQADAIARRVVELLDERESAQVKARGAKK